MTPPEVVKLSELTAPQRRLLVKVGHEGPMLRSMVRASRQQITARNLIHLKVAEWREIPFDPKSDSGFLIEDAGIDLNDPDIVPKWHLTTLCLTGRGKLLYSALTGVDAKERSQ